MLKQFIDRLDDVVSLDNNFLKNYDFIVTFGLYLKDLKSNVCLNPFLDTKTDFYIRYEVGNEEGVAALLLCEIGKDNCTAFTQELDYGYLSAESNVSKEELVELKNLLKQAKKPILLVGSDIYFHKMANNILQILAMLDLDVFITSKDKSKAYKLKSLQTMPDSTIELGECNGCIIYIDNTNDTKDEYVLKISNEFAKAWKLQDDEKIKISFENHTFNGVSKMDSSFGGVIGILQAGIDEIYPYKKVVIKKR